MRVSTRPIDGEETYRLALEPNTTGMSVSGSFDLTVWIDSETYIPKRAQSAVSSDNYSFETTQQYRNVSLNKSLSDDRFTIDVPDDAEEPGSSDFDMTSYSHESPKEQRTDPSTVYRDGNVASGESA